MVKQVSAAAGISSEAVFAKTGKTWKEWFTLLDKAGAKELSHKEIAEHLHAKHGCPGWWCQMITVGYEQERGLRVKNQSCTGDFTSNASKTIAVPIAELYRNWSDPKLCARWLPDSAKMTIRKANANKSMRITWFDGETSVEVYFWNKGPGKSQAAVQHSKLDDQKAVAKWKSYWSKALDKLQTHLEGATSRKPSTTKKPARRSGDRR